MVTASPLYVMGHMTGNMVCDGSHDSEHGV